MGGALNQMSASPFVQRTKPRKYTEQEVREIVRQTEVTWRHEPNLVDKLNDSKNMLSSAISNREAAERELERAEENEAFHRENVRSLSQQIKELGLVTEASVM